MTGKQVIVLIVENVETEIRGVRDIYEVVVMEETIWSNGPVQLRMICMGHIHRIRWKRGEDVLTELILVHDDGGS